MQRDVYSTRTDFETLELLPGLRDIEGAGAEEPHVVVVEFEDGSVASARGTASSDEPADWLVAASAEVARIGAPDAPDCRAKTFAMRRTSIKSFLGSSHEGEDQPEPTA